MQNYKNHIKTIRFLALTFFFLNCETNAQIDYSKEIIGTWISEEDTNWKMKFTETDNCYWYYENSITETFTYSISEYSCYNEFDSEYEYLKLSNTSGTFCYAINGITKDDDGKIYLSLEYDGKPKPMLFIKDE